MAKAALIVRILLGLLFFVSAIFAFAGMLGMTPAPEIPDGPMKTYMTGMMAAKYFLPFLKGTELVVGALLVSGFFVPLALIVLAPITLNILLVHTFIAPEGLPLAILILIAHLFLAYNYRAIYKPLLVKK